MPHIAEKMQARAASIAFGMRRNCAERENPDKARENAALWR
jgi:hypothetical protein